jgi:hypothetical protein
MRWMLPARVLDVRIDGESVLGDVHGLGKQRTRGGT